MLTLKEERLGLQEWRTVEAFLNVLEAWIQDHNANYLPSHWVTNCCYLFKKYYKMPFYNKISGSYSMLSFSSLQADPVAIVFHTGTTLAEFKKALLNCRPEGIQRWQMNTGGTNPFHSILSIEPSVALAKLKLLFQEAKRLGLDPNAQANLPGEAFQSVNYNNTPWHNYIANERYGLAIAFFDYAQEFGFKINLNLQDKEKKTGLLLALKMGNAPKELIGRLITEENYQTADIYGFTPAMAACATRHIDALKLLLAQEIKRLNLNISAESPLQLTADQKAALYPFVNQCHLETGKTLAHFAVLRAGSQSDLLKPVSYQQTLVNILQSVAVDGERDEKSPDNTALNNSGGQIVMSAEEIDFYTTMEKQGAFKKLDLSKLGLKDLSETKMIFTPLSFKGHEKVDNALLACTANKFLFVSKFIGENAVHFTKFKEKLKTFTGTSLKKAIIQKTPQLIDFLANIGADFSLKQSQGLKTPAEYVKGFANKEFKALVAPEDLNIIHPLHRRLESLAKECCDMPRMINSNISAIIPENQEQKTSVKLK